MCDNAYAMDTDIMYCAAGRKDDAGEKGTKISRARIHVVVGGDDVPLWGDIVAMAITCNKKYFRNNCVP